MNTSHVIFIYRNDGGLWDTIEPVFSSVSKNFLTYFLNYFPFLLINNYFLFTHISCLIPRSVILLGNYIGTGGHLMHCNFNQPLECITWPSCQCPAPNYMWGSVGHMEGCLSEAEAMCLREDMRQCICVGYHFIGSPPHLLSHLPI